MPRGHPDFTKPIAIIAQTLGVKLLPDWAAIQAEDVDIVAIAMVESGVSTVIFSYTVPEGKTLLFYDWSIALPNDDQHVFGWVWDDTADTPMGLGGGLKGFQVSYTKPKRIPSGHQLSIYAIQVSGYALVVAAHFGGALI